MKDSGNKYQVVRIDPRHLDEITLKGFSLSAAEAWPGLKDWLSNGYEGAAYTGLVSGEVVACAGVVILWPGVGEAWALVSPLVDQYPLFFHRAICSALDRIQARFNLHRIQCTVRADLEVGHRWIQRLGFECEGPLRRYGLDRADHLRYARVN